MKKITYLLLLASSMVFAQFPAPYCGPIAFSGNVEPISMVNFAGINNTSDPTAGATNGAHEDFTAMSAAVTAGQSYPISIQGNTDGPYTNNVSVFIDWNHNNVFTDAGEVYNLGTINTSNGVDTVVLGGFISVPGSAMGGDTRMRVVKKYSFSPTEFPNSCNTGDGGFGQAEDYTVSVTAIAACLSGSYFPLGVTTPSVCDGITPTIISDVNYAGDYFYVAVTAGQPYQFMSSVATDYLTLSTDDGLTATFSGTTPISWTSNFTGDLRVHLNTDSSCGTEDVDRETSVICGSVCLEGSQYPFDSAIIIDTCDGVTPVTLATATYAGEYCNVYVYSSNTYVFSSSIATDYLTIATVDGTTPLAVGTGSVTFAPTADGVIRFYAHLDANCGTDFDERDKSVICSTSVPTPDCAINLSPANGSTTVPAFEDIIFSWEAPTTGSAVVSYNVYGGLAADDLSLFGNTTDLTYNAGAAQQYDFVGYWQVVPVNAAGEAVGCPVNMFTTVSQPTDTPDYINLQYPPTITITQGGSDTVYGQVYKDGLTNVVPNIEGQAPGILAWIGISEEGDDSNPETWTNWTMMDWNSGSVGNNDEYQATIGANQNPGTYYYATRFTLNDGPFVYGGYTAAGGGIWDGTVNVSGKLTVNAAPAPENDECLAAIALTLDAATCDGVNTNGTTTGATDSGVGLLSCSFGASGVGDVWYSFTVPATVATVDISTDFLGGTSYDTEIALYAGTCGNLTEVDCDTDGGVVELPNGYSWNSTISNTPVVANLTYYVRVTAYTASMTGSFCLKVSTNEVLSTTDFDSANFTYYPNPVTNVLNLGYNENISQVEIYNLLGQKMTSNTFDATTVQMDMSNYTSGVYLVKVTSNNTTKTIRVIKE